MTYKLSIITINYNNKLGLEKTIESVVNQSVTDFEYIVIDGNSTDGSVGVIDKYVDRINYKVSEKDSGIYNAMNKGIKAANGEFVYFLNSGDVLLNSTTIATILQELHSDISIYYGNLYYSINSLRTLLWTPPKQLSFGYFLEYSLPHPASFIKKELFEKYFYYNESLKIVSDWEFFIYCICKQNESYKYLDVIVADFDNSGVSSNSANLNKIEIEKNSVLTAHFGLFIDHYSKSKPFFNKRFYQIQQIQRHKLKWKVLKGFLNLLFLGMKNEYKIEKYYHEL